MKIGVIGTGNIGGTLAPKLSAAFANQIGATAVDTRGATNNVDLVVISIPFPAAAQLPKDLFDPVSQDVPVIETGKYCPGLLDPLGPSEGSPGRIAIAVAGDDVRSKQLVWIS